MRDGLKRAIMVAWSRLLPGPVKILDGAPSLDHERAYAPHCDSAVLHRPGECEHCDAYPEWQDYRMVARIAFTGHTPQDGEVTCPSEQRRDISAINRWSGNRPAHTECLPTSQYAEREC